jgi:AraC family transcriptional regulator
MEAKIIELGPKKFIGIWMMMSLSDNKTSDLWRWFMPRLGEINNRVSGEFISLQNYGENWTFSPDKPFKKWALVEVSSVGDTPADMEAYELQGGKYAVFTHHGPASKAPATMKHIFIEWLPESGYSLDNREHFEVLPENYNPMDPNATEEIWILSKRNYK